MSNRNNKIRGPTSALTTFLKSKGINARNINAYGRIVQEGNDAAPAEPVIESPLPVDTVEEVEEQVESVVEIPRKRKSKPKKAKKKKKEENSSDLELDLPTREVKYSKNCLNCLKEIPEFYSRNSINLCNECSEAIYKKAKSNDKLPKIKRNTLWKIPDEFVVLKDKNESNFPTLVTICIKVLMDHLDHISDLGDLPQSVLLKISKIVGRYRKLDSRVLKLLINASLDEVYLPDCNQLLENDFNLIFNTCQSASIVNLSFCCKLQHSLANLPLMMRNITNLRIHGAYLATDEQWASCLSQLNELVVLDLSHASKFGILGTTALQSISTLMDLSITYTTVFNDKCLLLLKGYQLRFLNLSWPTLQLQNESIIDVIKTFGPTLEGLYLDGYSNMDDSVLLNGIAPYCVSLKQLSISQSKVTDEGIYRLLDSLNLKLDSINLMKCDLLTSECIILLLKEFGKTISNLNLNGLQQISTDVFVAMAKYCPSLIQLDVSWCLSFNDLSFQTLKNNCDYIEYITCFGCNELTTTVVQKQYNLKGKQIRVLGTEFQHLMQQ